MNDGQTDRNKLVWIKSLIENLAPFLKQTVVKFCQICKMVLALWKNDAQVFLVLPVVENFDP